MSQNKINVEVTDNGSLKELNSEALKLRQNIEGAAKSLPKAAAAAKGAPDTREYNTAKGIAGATGAAGRDFAKQAQGLGGLVHLYATFAANIFAVGAAFNALQKAADTTNLVKGLDQLGAASGRGLGQLSQDVVKATDGAVSLREAMTAVAQASSAGMSDKDIKRLATGAKQASQALGVDMGDALSRLSRGITKLEPELLDELGIFVRVDKAAQDYAKSVGKPVSALTDLEKRSAFANAALKQVEQKFGEINIDSNPYTQLAAQFKNVTDSGLNMVNTVVGPLIKLLGASPTALAAALALVTTKLVGQAIPAIGQYRTGLKDAADQAKDLAIAKASIAKETYKKVQGTIADVDVANADKAIASFMDRTAKTTAKGTLEIRKLANETAHLYDKNDEGAKRTIAAIDAMIAKNTSLKGTYVALRDSIIRAQEAQERAVTAKPGLFDPARGAIESARRAESKSIRSSLIAQASEDASTGGVRYAWSKMGEQLDASKGKISAVDKYMGILGGTLSAVTTRVIGLGSALMGAFGWISAIIGIGAMLFSFFSTNEKQAAKFSESINSANNSADTLNNTIDRLYSSKNSEQFLAPASVLARATALTTLKESLSEVVSSYDKVANARSWTDSITNFLAEFIDKSDEDALVKAVSSQISAAYKAAKSDPKLQKLASDLSPLMAKGRKLEREDLDVAIGILGNVSAYQKYANAISDTEGAIKTLNKATLDLQNTYKVNSPLAGQINAITTLSASTLRLVNSGDLTVTTLSSIKDGLDALKASGIASTSAIDSITSKINSIDISSLREFEDKLRTAKSILARDPSDKDALFDVKYYSGKIDQIKTKLSEVRTDIKGQFSTAFIDSVKILSIELDKEFAKARNITATAQLGLYGTDSSAKIQQEAKIKIAEIASIEAASAAVDKFALSMYEATLAADRMAVLGKRSDAGVTTGFISELESALGGKGGALKNIASLAEKYKDSGDTDKLDMLNKYKVYAEQKDKIAARKAISGAQIGAIKTNESISLGDLESKTSAENTYNVAKRSLELDKAKLETRKSLGELTDSEHLAQKGALELHEYEISRAKEYASIIRDSEKAMQLKNTAEQTAALAEVATRARAFNMQTDADKIAKSTATQTAVLAAKKAEDLAREQNIIQFNTTQYERQLQTEEASNDLASQRLDQLSAEGSISDDLLNKEKSKLALIKAELDFQTAYIKAVNDFNAKTKKDADLVKKGGDTQVVKDAQARLDTESAGFAKTVEGLLNVKTKATDAAKNIDSMSASMKVLNNWGQKFSNTFADAIFDATQSGKWDFKDMVNSMIADLGRLMLRQQMSNALADAGGTSNVLGGLWDVGKALFGVSGGASAGASATSAAGTTDLAGTMALMAANGASFNAGGVQAFAKGGSFTNSIVDSPTLFKFAKGTGLMGEAGPEAIMPLSRDSSGKLGVSANIPASETTVVINNYSAEKAAAKESLDSRGQRRIEVTIGDMVAGEIGRAGSSAQQSIKSSFGKQPQLLRR